MTRFSEACAGAARWLDTLDLGAAAPGLMTSEGVQMVHALALSNLELMADRDPEMPLCGHGLLSVLVSTMREAGGIGPLLSEGEAQRTATNLVSTRLVVAGILAHLGEPPSDLRTFLVGYDLRGMLASAALLSQLCDPRDDRDDGDPQPEPQPDPTPGVREDA